MQMIAVCGHDDTFEDKDAVRPETYKDDFNKERRSHVLQKMQLAKIDEDEVSSLEGDSRCPTNHSRIYLPQSLGTQYDLSTEYKARLAKIQAPYKGASYLPAKYYHTIGGAYASCLLTRRGVPEFLVSKAQSLGVIAYRSRYLCEAKGWKVLKDPSYVFDLPSVREMIVSDNQPQRLAGEELLVFEMLRKMPKFNKITNCQDIDVEGTTLQALRDISHGPCRKDWTKDECDRARYRALTWVADYEWSLEQHKVGNQFAYDNCPSIGSHTDPIRNSCSALKEIIEKRKAQAATTGAISRSSVVAPVQSVQ
jgi:hypothetical protein